MSYANVILWLEQSSRGRFGRLSYVVQEFGLRRSQEYILLVVHVNDVVITRDDVREVTIIFIVCNQRFRALIVFFLEIEAD